MVRLPLNLSEHWPSSWATEGPILRASSSESFVSLWAYRRLGLHLTIAQTNGQVERAHQMLMCMTGKLSKDWKEDWLKHLPELMHAYNSMRLAITRYSPYYSMFGSLTVLTHWLLFPHGQGYTEIPTCQPLHSLSCMKDCTRPLKRLKCSPHQRWRDRCDTMIGRLMLFHMDPGDLVLAKVIAYRGRRKVKDWVGGGTIWSSAPNCRGHPFLPHEKPAD